MTATLKQNEKMSLPEACSTWKQKQRRIREQAILEAAQVLIAEHGYDSMTMDELAEKVGISKPTLYQHFPSKEILAVRSVAVIMERNLEFMAQLDPNLKAFERLEQVVRWVIDQRFRSEHAIYGAAKASLIGAVRSHPDCRIVRQNVHESMIKLFEDAKAEGEIDSSLSMRTLMQMLFSLVRDTEYEEYIDNGECTAEEMAETMATVYLNGMRKVKKQ